MLTSSCKKEETNDEPTEVIADNDTFKDFRNWTLRADNTGPDPALGGAHAENDASVTRYIYFENNQSAQDGTYSLGTVVVKESKNDALTVQVITAMVKRGNNFNPDGGDWEWFMLNPDGTIATDNDGNEMRGDDLMNGMCLNCHSQNSATDYVFTE